MIFKFILNKLILILRNLSIVYFFGGIENLGYRFLLKWLYKFLKMLVYRLVVGSFFFKECLFLN